MYVCCVLHCDVITGEPIKFPSNQVIKGWQEGLLRMKAGSKATMVIPSDLAYGDTGENMLVYNASVLTHHLQL
jgi:FKBP-type peptidyl-prolyl cis-trans isomerase